MLIKEVNVKNFRSILDESLPCDSLTALVGRNGSGKSSFLTAIDLFYNPAAKVATEDYYSEDTTRTIEIAVAFTDLTSAERAFFSAYIDQDTLTVVRVFSETLGSRSGTYYGIRLQNPDFVSVRNASGKMGIRSKYKELSETEKYSSFPPARTADQALSALADWESQNPEQCCPLRDDGQFFGFTQVAQGYLGRYTRFIPIPAVRDAQEDAIDHRGSPVTEIMDLVVRSALANREDLDEFRRKTQDRYREIMDPEQLTELTNLERNLSDTLQFYVPDAGVLLRWSAFADIAIPMPQTQVKLREDGYESTVERTGHGLQRAFILTMLQHLAAARGAEVTPDGEVPQLPNLVLGIEEPELYQHPSRQRHLASVLLKLATGAIRGVAENTQVVYTTHSPLLIGLERFAQLRVLRKVPNQAELPKVTQLREADMDAVAEELRTASGEEREAFTSETLRPRLQAIMTPWMNEGFFADVAVLVEGEDDRAAVFGVANSMGIDLDGKGIAVIPCFGKANLDRPLVIFRHLGIPVYVVWDGDRNGRDSKPEKNKYLLRLLGQPEEDWPDFIRDSCACFRNKLEETLQGEIGSDTFRRLLAKAQQEFDIARRDQALKNAAVIQHIIENAASEGKTSGSLTSIVKKVVTLKTQSEASA